MTRRGPQGTPAAKSGAWFRAQRYELGMTQRELAAEMGISEAEVSRKEAGLRKVLPEHVAIVERILKKYGKFR